MRRRLTRRGTWTVVGTRGAPLPWETMSGLRSGALSIDVSRPRPGLLRVDWKGKCNAPTGALTPFFDDLIREARAAQAEIEMRFEAVEHFDSSTVTALIQLVQRLRDEDVRLTLCYDPRLTWQRLSFDALRVFDRGDGLLSLREAL